MWLISQKCSCAQGLKPWSLKDAGTRSRTFVKSSVSQDWKMPSNVSSSWRWGWCLGWEGERGGWQDGSCVGRGRIQAVLEMATGKLSRYLNGSLSYSKWAGDTISLCQKITLVSRCGTWVIEILSRTRPRLFPKCEDVLFLEYVVMVGGCSSDCMIASIF